MKNINEQKIDVLFIGAHQDDVDAVVGGTVILLKDKGYKVEILDLTKRKGMYFSDEEIKGQEAQKAAKVMGVKRSVIDLGLLRIANSHENKVKIAEFIRQRKPDVVAIPTNDSTHPDHKVAHQLILDSLHFSFATAIKTKSPPWRVKKTYYYPTDVLFKLPPNNVFFIDISQTFERKMEALKCYASQFLFHAHNQKYEFEYLKAMNRYWGLLIKREYAEVIMTDLPILEPFPELTKK